MTLDERKKGVAVNILLPVDPESLTSFWPANVYPVHGTQAGNHRVCSGTACDSPAFPFL